MADSFESLRSLLRAPAEAAEVFALTGVKASQIERFEHTGFVDLPPVGISVIFKEATRVLADVKPDCSDLVVSALHFHAKGHEGHLGYVGPLPISLGATETEIVEALGPPAKTGGGGFSNLLKKPIPRWLRYNFGDDIFQVQLSPSGQAEMVTLFVLDRLQPI